MSLKVEKLENNMAKLTIEVAAEEFEKACEKAYQKAKNKINIPGFRKGKAPRKMIEKMYGKEVFYEDAANIVIPDAYEKALEECTEEITSAPKIEVISCGADEPFVFTAEVAIRPEVTLGKYLGVKIDKIDVDVTDAEVDAELDRVREQNARIINVEDRAVKDGDQTVIDFEGFVDGVAFEGGKGTDYPLTIGSGAFIPGFEEALIGAELNKEVDVNVTFPEDYQASELAGKAAVFKCTVKEIKEKELPELNDEFAEDANGTDLATYKEEIKKNLGEKKARDAKYLKEEAVVNAIIADSKMDIPDAMLQTTQRDMVEEFAQRMQAQGITAEQYLKYTGMTADMLMEQMKPQALARIQSRLVMQAVAKAENIEVTEEELDDEIKVMAETYQIELDRAKELLGEKGLSSVKIDLAVKKAVDLCVENAKEAKPTKPRAKKAKAAEVVEEAPAEE